LFSVISRQTCYWHQGSLPAAWLFMGPPSETNDTRTERWNFRVPKVQTLGVTTASTFDSRMQSNSYTDPSILRHVKLQALSHTAQHNYPPPQKKHRQHAAKSLHEITLSYCGRDVMQTSHLQLVPQFRLLSPLPIYTALTGCHYNYTTVLCPPQTVPCD
jgi:hypothetical protein